MIIFPKRDVIPIIVPQICFKDRYNNMNNYAEMNPSIFIEEDGTTTILVRCVNYKKFNNKHFTLYQAHSNSVYYLLKGKITDSVKLDVENFEYHLIEPIFNLPNYPTYWFGLEDIRFVNSNTILTIVPQLNEGGSPSIFKAELNDNKITNFTHCKPNKIEKNWMPYIYNDAQRVIYSLNPFIIKSIETDDMQEITVTDLVRDKLAGYHGSTNGIPFLQESGDGWFLFLVHVNREKTYHRMLLFNAITNDIQLSEEFIFFKNPYIEFTCSISKYNDRIFITIGVNDDKAYIIETCTEDINSIFPEPLPEGPKIY
jgi:hypothetical protein